MRKKKIIIIIMSVAILVILTTRIAGMVKTRIYGDKSTSSELGIDDVYIQRALAAKMLALLKYSHNEIKGMEPEITYIDACNGEWYDKYFTASGMLGIHWGGNECRPQDELTYRECIDIVSEMAGDTDGIIKEKVKQMLGKFEYDENISAGKWLTVYEAIPSFLGEGECRKILKEDLFLLALLDKDNNSWEAATGSGAYHFDGFALDAYANRTLSVLSDGNEIIYIYGVSEKDTVINNAWIDTCSGEQMIIYYSGVFAEFNLSNALKESMAPVQGTVADITISSDRVTDIKIKGERINDRILSVNDAYIDTASYGRLMFAENYKVYGIYDEAKQLGISDISVGYSVADIVVENNTVCAVLVTGQVTPANIRVAIMTTGYKGYYHQKAVISSDTGMVLRVNGAEYRYAAGEEVGFLPDNELLKQGRVTIAPENGGRLLIKSVKRNGEAHYYRGIIELNCAENAIVIINELSIDEYLYAVVPSEMPVSYNMEALKAQAVCARSYAYMQVMSGGLSDIGAHVDDSTAYQVYNNTPETPESIEAVNQTSGCVITYNGDIVSAYYFSTSCGHTANGADVWFGMKNVEYLSAVLQNDVSINETYDLSDEKVFRNFINNNPVTTYDAAFPWYRWQVRLSEKQVRSSLEKSIQGRYNINPSLILTKDENGNYVSRKIDKIGKIKNIKVGKRSDGGIITSLIIKGSKKTVKVLSEYNIRLLLAPAESIIKRNDESTVNGLSLLPSAFFYTDTQKENGEKIFILHGGGYGHGVGMSQNGASKMADSGYTYTQILEHYYKGCHVEKR